MMLWIKKHTRLYILSTDNTHKLIIHLGNGGGREMLKLLYQKSYISKNKSLVN
jgi:hypothetical protein